MANTVFANGMAVACKAGNGKVIAAFPDVCLSPPSPPAGPVPLPYPLSSSASDTSSGSKKIKINKKEVMLKDKSFYKKCKGDEAATRSFGMGQITHKLGGKVYFISWSMDVKFEGENVVRHLDMTTSNHSSKPGNASVPAGNTSSGSSGAPKCPPHAWKRLPDEDTTQDRIKKLENSGNAGDSYNACLAKKFQNQGKKVDVSARFKCDCGEYQEVDLIVDGELGEAKAGNQSAGKRQTLNYVDISNVLFNGAPVTIFYQGAARAAREIPHVSNWGANAKHEPCP
jgi:hypothetical protein